MGPSVHPSPDRYNPFESRTMKIRLSLICLAALAPALAMANIIPSQTTITGTGPYLWTYNLQLAADQTVVPGPIPTGSGVSNLEFVSGSLITIYDFDGYVAGSCAGPTGWTCTTQFIGITPIDVVPIDNAGILNLTWVYTSGSPISGQPNGVDLGMFSAQSIYNTVTQVSYASRAVKNVSGQAGTIGDNVGQTQGPTAGRAIPEPGSLALAGLGLLGLGLVRRRKGA